MALSDPQSVTISGSAKSLAGIGSSLTEGRYQDSAGEITLVTKQDSGRRLRHIVELRKTSIVADPLFPSQNLNVGSTVRITVDRPRNGVTAADAGALADALIAWATSANIAKIIGGQL